MELFTPDLGLLFWTIFAFAIFLFVMKKFAWKPLLSIIHEREQSIEEALSIAEKARKEFADLEKEHKRLIREAQEERMTVLAEARTEKSAIIAEAKEEASKNAARLLENARTEIKLEREAIFNEMKNEIARFSVQIAEVILKQKLENKSVQQQLIDDYIKELKIN